MRPEQQIETEAVDLVRTHLGIEGVKLAMPGDTGWADRMFMMPGGKPFLIEFKQPGEFLEPKQLFYFNKLRKMGYDIEAHDHAGRAFVAVARAVDPSHLSEAGCKVLADTRRRWLAPRPWFGEDDYCLGSPQATLQGWDHLQGSGDRAFAGLFQHLAWGDRKVGRLQPPTLRGAARPKQGRAPRARG